MPEAPASDLSTGSLAPRRPDVTGRRRDFSCIAGGLPGAHRYLSPALRRARVAVAGARRAPTSSAAPPAPATHHAPPPSASRIPALLRTDLFRGVSGCGGLAQS